jgi:iron complex transport system ATP-binding protein
MDDTGLSASEVSFSYRGGPAVLRAVSVRVPRRGLIGVLGPNGSGKTTLLRLLGGLLRPSDGRVTLDGIDLQAIGRPTIARRIAMVPQETQLAFEYTVLEMAMMGRYPHLGAFEIEGPADLEIARNALRATGTLHLESRLFTTLSGGEKQRVIIAGALAQNPDILLLDEPTASLDLAYQLQIRLILHKLNADRQLTIVVSTHDLNLAASLCRDVVLLDRGRVLAAGATASMLDAALIQTLYGVEVDVTTNTRTGHLMIVPVARETESRQP